MFKSLDLSAIPEKEAAAYSYSEAILSAAQNLKVENRAKDFHCEIQKQLGRPPRFVGGIFAPWQLRPNMAGLDTKTNAAGKYLVGQGPVELISALRPQCQVMRAGAVVLPNQTAQVAFASEGTVTQASWVAENPGSDVSDSDGSFGLKTAVPKILQGSTSFSKQLLNQSDIETENYVRFSLTEAHAIAIDAGAIAGSGTQSQPVGLLSIASLPKVSIAADGGALTYDHLVAMEQTIADAHADTSELVWITTPAIRGKLRKTYFSGSTPVWDGRGPLGYQGFVSKNCPANLTKGSGQNLSAVLLGDWRNLIIPMFGAFELVVDPFAGKKQGVVQVTSIQMCDILVKRIGAFCAVVDAA
jgi:HK97 family phage major capsid protein